VIVRLRKGLLIATAEEGEERGTLLAWLRDYAGHAFRLREIEGGSAYFQSLGPQEAACRVPINITSKSPAPLDVISNFAETPFYLDGMTYASVEGFWQALKFPHDQDRRRVAALHGGEAKRAGDAAPALPTIVYNGEEVTVGTYAHWRLMARACAAKFKQNAQARDVLLGTGERPLEHKMRRDSRTIPGVIMAEIWMRVRHELQQAKGVNIADQ
jgi:predicted NAD-dependent protein-ADP-ribosyltransferase YbiA (DUF1768 family)